MKNQLRFEKRRQARLARQRANRKNLTHRFSKEPLMSRAQDLAAVDLKIKEVIAARDQIVQTYDLYKVDVATQIEKIMRDAGIWDTVNQLETERTQRLQKDQAQVNALEAKLNEYGKVQEFLRKREEEAPEPVVPEYVNGIDISQLDHETRIMVQAGNADTIAALKNNPKVVESVATAPPAKKADKKLAEKAAS